MMTTVMPYHCKKHVLQPLSGLTGLHYLALGAQMVMRFTCLFCAQALQATEFLARQLDQSLDFASEVVSNQVASQVNEYCNLRLAERVSIKIINQTNEELMNIIYEGVRTK